MMMMIDQLQLLRDCLVVTIYLYQIIYYTLHVQYFDAMRCHYLSPLNHFISPNEVVHALKPLRLVQLFRNTHSKLLLLHGFIQ